MRVTIVGSGDAFGSGARAHTCFRIDCEGGTLVVDFGASAITAWKRCGFSSDAIDAVIVSHLHGDHFAGLPFLLLECQFEVRRARPLVLAGPVGFRARLERTLEALFPGSLAIEWRFPWHVLEVASGDPVEIAGFTIETREVEHPAGAPSTAVRVSRGRKVFAYSGDTGWTTALLDIAKGADLFIVECFSGEQRISNHIDWPMLKKKLSRFTNPRIVVTHMNDSALARSTEMEAAGLIVAHDGLCLDL